VSVATAELVEGDSQKLAFVFPGQGSQYVGMGKALYEASSAARRVFQQADDVLGFKLSQLCFEGPAEELEDTMNAQPAILTVSMACLAAVRERLEALGQKWQPPRFVAGHSLGEYTALVAAGALEFSDALRLVRERGRLMKEQGDHRPGGMAALRAGFGRDGSDRGRGQREFAGAVRDLR
jgi:[acyl-carrier-protein] S-malonyltransferase